MAGAEEFHKANENILAVGRNDCEIKYKNSADDPIEFSGTKINDTLICPETRS